MCVVLVLVAVRFASWTMMAVLCISVDDFVLFFFRTRFAAAPSIFISPPHQVCTAADTAGNEIHTFLPVPHRSPSYA